MKEKTPKPFLPM